MENKKDIHLSYSLHFVVVLVMALLCGIFAWAAKFSAGGILGSFLIGGFIGEVFSIGIHYVHSKSAK